MYFSGSINAAKRSSNPKSHVTNSQDPPSHARATTAHLNAPFDAKHHSVSTIGKLTVATQAFLCDKAPLSGIGVVECVDRLLLENRMSPFGAKIVFVPQLGLSTSFCALSRKNRFIVKNFKRCSFWKDFRLDE